MSESLKSQDLQARAAAAIAHHKAGRFKEAELAYNKILHIFPSMHLSNSRSGVQRA